MRPLWSTLIVVGLVVGCVCLMVGSCGKKANGAQTTKPSKANTPATAPVSPLADIGPTRPMYGYLRQYSAYGPRRAVVVVVAPRRPRLVVVQVR